jgi:putative heme-binding domain-containing protein
VPSGAWQSLAVTFQTEEAGGNGLYLSHDDLRRPINPQRIFVPWATEKSETPQALIAAQPRQDVKGNWLNGRRLFFSQATCFTCHVIRGEGTAFGPELTNLVFRDRASVVQDIMRPSATINPDHTASLITLKDGSQISGIIRQAVGDKLTVALPGGVRMDLERTKVASTEPLKTSLMPEGLWPLLSATQQEDLLTFLLTNPLEPAIITRLDPPAPPARSLKEIASILPAVPNADTRAKWKPLRILLASSAKDHGIDEHDYPVFQQRWSRLLALAEGVTVTTCENFPTAAQLDAADVVVFYSNNHGWDLPGAALLDTFQKRGGGLVYLHWGIEGGKETAALAERVGQAFSMSAFRHGPMDLVFTDSANPITHGLPNLRFLDESYWKLHGDPKRISVLATSLEDNEPRPQVWTYEHHGGRVFGCIPGHYTWTHDDPLYRLLVLRGLSWAARQDDIERLSELATVGARLSP